MNTPDNNLRRAVTDGCARDAATVFELLCDNPATGIQCYDGAYTITVGRIRAHFTPHGVELTFPDPLLTLCDPTVTVTVAGDWNFGAMHTLITALSLAVNR